MYEIAIEKIKDGLSIGSRIALGSVSALFGFIMLMSAADSMAPMGIYLFGSFCFAISLACLTWGRVRQFVGSVISTVIVCLSFWYLWLEINGSTFISGSRSEPSALNAILFSFIFGIPSAIYVFKARFGFHPKQP
jgi:hypothetical protein